MIIVDYTNEVVLYVMLAFFLLMGIFSSVKKNAWFAMTAVIVSLVMLVLHVGLKDYYDKDVLMYNAFIDFVTLAINIPLLLIVDEIEARRGVINKVFEHKYKK